MARAKGHMPSRWPNARKEAFRRACVRGDTIADLAAEFGLTWETAKRYRRAELNNAGRQPKNLGTGLWQFASKLVNPGASDYSKARDAASAMAAFEASWNAFVSGLPDEDLACLAHLLIDESDMGEKEKDLQRSMRDAVLDLWLEELGEEPTAEFHASIEAAPTPLALSLLDDGKGNVPFALLIDRLRKTEKRTK